MIRQYPCPMPPAPMTPNRKVRSLRLAVERRLRGLLRMLTSLLRECRLNRNRVPCQTGEVNKNSHSQTGLQCGASVRSIYAFKMASTSKCVLLSETPAFVAMKDSEKLNEYGCSIFFFFVIIPASIFYLYFSRLFFQKSLVIFCLLSRNSAGTRHADGRFLGNIYQCRIKDGPGISP